MSADHVLALDAGTSGARCLVFGPDGRTLAAVRREWSYESPPEIAPLGKSFEPDAFWSILCDLARGALAEAKVSATDLGAVGVTSQRQAIVVIDGDGRSLCAGPNVDVRALAEGLAIDAQYGDQVYASTGMLPSVLSAAARLQWLRRHHEADFRRAAAVLTMGDWIAYRLTGERASERSLASGCGLLHVPTAGRDTDLLKTLDFPTGILPPLVSGTDVVGRVTDAAAEASGLAPGTPVAIGGADTQCGLVGMGVEKPGEVGIVVGWSSPVQQVTAEPRLDPDRRTWASVHAVPGRWIVESSAADAGQVWRWCCETVLGKNGRALDEGSALAAEASPGAGDVLAFLGPAAMNAAAMGVRLGGILIPTPLAALPVDRPELLRAVLENIAYALRANVEQAEQVSGLEAPRIAVGGGLTRAPVFPRILADVLGRPTDVAQEIEVSARGAAIMAARAAGLQPPPQPAAVQRIEPDAAASDAYRHRYERWRRMGEALQATQERA